VRYTRPNPLLFTVTGVEEETNHKHIPMTVVSACFVFMGLAILVVRPKRPRLYSEI